MTIVRRVARPLLAAAFIVGGLDQVRRPQSKAAAAEPIVDKVAEPLHLPKDTELLVRANGALMLAGGALLATGRFPRPAAALLAGSLVPTTVAGHDFWNETDAQARKAKLNGFLANLGLLGGLLLAVVDTEGKPGLAYRAKMAGDAASRTARSARREARLAAARAQNALG